MSKDCAGRRCGVGLMLLVLAVVAGSAFAGVVQLDASGTRRTGDADLPYILTLVIVPVDEGGERAELPTNEIRAEGPMTKEREPGEKATLRVRVLSSVTGAPVAGYRLSGTGDPRAWTDDEGVAAFEVDLSAPFHVGHSLLERNSLERLPAVEILPEMMQKAIGEGKPIELHTLRSGVVGRLELPAGDTATLSGGVTVVYMADGVQHMRRVMMRQNVFYIHDTEALPDGTSGRVFAVYSDCGEYVITGEAPHALSSEGAPVRVTVPVRAGKPVQFAVTARDKGTGQGITNALVEIHEQDRMKSGRTAQDGVAAITDVPMGRIKVKVAHPDYEGTTIEHLLHQEGDNVEVLLERLFVVPVRLKAKEFDRHVVIGSYWDGFIRESNADVPAGSESCVVRGVRRGKAAIGVIADCGKLLSIGLVDIEPDVVVQVEDAVLATVSIDIKALPDTVVRAKHEMPIRHVLLVDRETMLRMKVVPHPCYGVIANVVLPARQYYLFDYTLSDDTLRVIGSLDLRDATADRPTVVEYHPPADSAKTYQFRDVMENRDWRE